MTDHLNDIVEGIKKSMESEEEDYITVMIVALIGTEEEVLEAEITCQTYFHQGDLPCKSARITMSGWKGKAKEDCSHEWTADQNNDCNTCIKCGARQEIYTDA